MCPPNPQPHTHTARPRAHMRRTAEPPPVTRIARPVPSPILSALPTQLLTPIPSHHHHRHDPPPLPSPPPIAATTGLATPAPPPSPLASRRSRRCGSSTSGTPHGPGGERGEGRRLRRLREKRGGSEGITRRASGRAGGCELGGRGGACGALRARKLESIRILGGGLRGAADQIMDQICECLLVT